MRHDESSWYSASYDSTPDLGALHELRDVYAPRIPFYFVRSGGFAVTLYLPPEAARFVEIATRDGRLKPFEPCPKPASSVHLLFGEEADVHRHFPAKTNVLRFRQTKVND